MISMKNIEEIYYVLLNRYSYQGWWPLINFKGKNPDKTGSVSGYHPKDYSFPRNQEEQVEIILGAILTQNTSWTGVEKALININQLDVDFDPILILETMENNEESFKEAIKPTGYFNQKFTYIKNVLEFYIDLNGAIPSRKELLKVKGVGDETADSILLYGYKQEEFVVDAYTKRIFSYLGYIDIKDKYIKVKELFEENLDNNYEVYQEYHGLIVEHAKRFYTKKPYGINDDLLKTFKIQ
jgi:endonuclease-3 related protein